MLDCVIKNGQVYDGTGAPPVSADIGIHSGKIVTIGGVDQDAVWSIDATEKFVTPGFIDVHTHYDAQAFWDTTLSPSPLHGVTTVLGGNCGFTIAPLAAEQSDYLMRMLARVEGMSLESLQRAVPWNWHTFGEWLDTLEGTLSVNAGFLVGHSAIRRYVMGDRAVGSTCSDDELARMKRLLAESFEAGGLGFSSSWSPTHNDGDSNPVPSRHADDRELLALAGMCKEFEGTSLEFIPSFGRFDAEAIDIMARLSIAANRPLNWNLLTPATNARQLDILKTNLGASDYAGRRGGKVVALTVPCPVVTRLSFDHGIGLQMLNGWHEPMALPKEQKLAMLRDRQRRNELDELAQGPSAMRGLARWALLRIGEVFSEENTQYGGRTIGEIAEADQRSPFDVLAEIVIADDLQTGLYPPVADDDDTWALRAQTWLDERTVLGGTDAGAHLDMLATFNASTVMLRSAVRDRELLTWEQAVHQLTQVPAQLYGLRQRGRLEGGYWADICVIDPHTVGPEDVYARHDLPGGAWRLYGGATGVDHVLVNGEEIVRDGEFTASRPGTILRSGRDTAGTAVQ
jgi:N-acyl-D-aspartate/D-glutamate deacylase